MLSVNDLHELLDRISDIMSIKAQEKNIEFICTIAPDVPTLLIGDPDRLQQILLNLVTNGLKFTSEGEVVVQVTKGTEDARQITLHFLIQDTGIGIASEHYNLIFEQFRQIDGSNTRKYGGTGLGLAICKNLVRMMGGRIWVESKADEGALFQVELPISSSNESKVKALISEKKLASAVSNQQLSVLVVDDEPDSLTLFSEMLTTLGHMVLTAESGYEALKLLEQLPQPDLIFMDIQMPVLSGTDTLRLIRERYTGMKVVAQSAHALVGDRDRFLKQGYDEYLSKPFSKEQLAGVISIFK